MVRSYELGVLFLPRLEQAYRRHRHCGFSCTQPPPIPLPQGKQLNSLSPLISINFEGNDYNFEFGTLCLRILALGTLVLAQKNGHVSGLDDKTLI